RAAAPGRGRAGPAGTDDGPRRGVRGVGGTAAHRGRPGRRARRVRPGAGGTGRRRGPHPAVRRRDRPGVREVPTPSGRLRRSDGGQLVTHLFVFFDTPVTARTAS